MNRLSAGVLVLCLCAVGSRAEEPRAVIEKAVKSVGGADLLSLGAAVHSKHKGTIRVGELKQEFTVQYESFTQDNGTCRMVFRLDMGGNGGLQVEILQFRSPDGSWYRSMDGQASKLAGDELPPLEMGLYMDRLTSLLPLLKDKDFTLAGLPDEKVQGRPAAGVKVSSKGKPDVQMYFDKESGLLAKFSYRGPDGSGNKDVLHETFPSEYRTVGVGPHLEAVLKKAGVGSSDQEVLAFLRRLAPAPDVLVKVRKLIGDLSSDTFEVREKAGDELVALGAVAVPLLQQAAKDDDVEVARRAKDCLELIKVRDTSETATAAIQVLGLRQPAGTAEALLAYLPGADKAVSREVWAALHHLARKEGPAKQALVKALEDADPARRAAARAALGKDDGAFLKEPGRRLYLPGFKYPARTVFGNDGKMAATATMELTEIGFFNRFDDKLFAPPPAQ
jgi:hypothetical protein